MDDASPSKQTADDKAKEKEDEAKVTHIVRKKVVRSATFGGFPEVQVSLREFEEVQAVKGARLVEGFFGFSITPVICANFLVDALELPLVGVITANGFPARCVIDKGQPGHSLRLFGNKHVVVVLSEIKLGAGFVYSVMEALLDFCAHHDINQIISIEGIPMDKDMQMKMINRMRRARAASPIGGTNSPHMAGLSMDDAKEELDLFFLTSNPELHERMKSEEMKCRPVPSGIIDGMTGALLAELPIRPHTPDILCIFAPSHPQLPDAHGAMAVIKVLDRLLEDVHIDLKPLEDKAVEIEGIVSQVLMAAQPAAKTMNPAAQMMYV